MSHAAPCGEDVSRDREATDRFLRYCDTAPQRWQDTLNARFKMFGIARKRVTNDERG